MTISAKYSILDVWQGSDYASGLLRLFCCGSKRDTPNLYLIQTKNFPLFWDRICKYNISAISYMHQNSGACTGVCTCDCTHQMKKTAIESQRERNACLMRKCRSIILKWKSSLSIHLPVFPYFSNTNLTNLWWQPLADHISYMPSVFRSSRKWRDHQNSTFEFLNRICLLISPSLLTDRLLFQHFVKFLDNNEC